MLKQFECSVTPNLHLTLLGLNLSNIYFAQIKHIVMNKEKKMFVSITNDSLFVRSV